MLHNKQAERITDFFWLKSRWFRQTLDRIQPPDSLVMVITSTIVGIGTGLGAVLFVRLLVLVNEGVNWLQGQVGVTIGLLLGMVAAGLVVGWMIERWASEAKGHGVPEVMEAVALRNGRIRPRVAVVKVLASALTIGTGGSAGREGPIVQVGSALGSTIGQLLHFSAERVRTLVACGAAAGIAATFNAPIAGAIFALEVILGKFTTRYFGAVVISSVAAGVIGRIFLSDKPAFAVPAYPLGSFAELPIYVVLGLLAAVVAVLFIRILYRVEGFVEKIPVRLPIKAAFGMALTLGIALLLPERQVLGPGLEFIGEAIAEDFSLPMGLMVAMLLLKLLSTCFTLGTGNSGGVFAPGLFMGAVLGGIVGTVAHQLWPDVAVNPGAYAIVGMAAVFAGTARAPITAVLIVFEMSNDYQLILPLMLSVVLSTLIAEHLFQESIYTLKLRLKGITLQRGRDLDLLQSILVSEAMTSDPYVVQSNMPVTELGRRFQQTHSHSFPVVDQQSNLVGMVSLRDYERIDLWENSDNLQVKDIASMGNLLTVYEDEPVSRAIERLSLRGVNKIPVIRRDAPAKVVGVVRRRDIIKAYNLALMRRARGQFDEEKARLRRVDDTLFVEIELSADSPSAYQTLVSLGAKLPHDSVIVSIRRNGTLLIPHGDTVFQPNDVVQVFLKQSDEVFLRKCMLGDAPAN